MRLTVHVTGANKTKVEKKLKDGTIKTFWKCPSTLSYKNIQPEDIANILNMIVKDKLGFPFKHYISNDKPIGEAKIQKKK